MVDKLPPDFAGWADQPEQPPSAVQPPALQAAPLPPPRPADLGMSPVPADAYPQGAPEPPARPPELGAGVKMPADFAGWADEQPDLFSVIGEAGKRGLREGFKSAREGVDVIARGGFDQNVHPVEQDDSPVGQLLRTPMSEGWRNPKWWAAHIASGAAGAAPSFALGATGAAGGSVAAGPAGGLVGGALGFGAGAALQTLAPVYQRARQEGLDHDAAVDRAMKETGIAGAFGTVMGLAPGGAAFGKTAEGALRRPISEALLQIFGVQPALMGGQKASENAVEGKPLLEGVPESAAVGAATGAALVGGHAAARAGRRAVMGEPQPAAPPPGSVDDFLRQADEAEARARGAQTRAEIDEFIRQKEAAANAPVQSGLALPAPTDGAKPSPAGPEAAPARPNDQGPAPAGPQDRNDVRQPGTTGGAADVRNPAGVDSGPRVLAPERGNAAVEAENAALREQGWSDEEIGLMSPKERAAELKSSGFVAKPADQAPDSGTPDGRAKIIETSKQAIAAADRVLADPAATENDRIIAQSRKKAEAATISRMAEIEADNAAETKAAGTRSRPVKVEAPDDIAPVREQVNTAPTEAQAEAGNYRKGHVTFDGLPVSIENPKGSTRSGTDPDGKPWSVEMPGDYGYIKGTKGADKDHVDILIGDKGPTGKAFVVDQIDPKTGAFDEHKVIAGVSSVGEAARLYSKGFSDGSGPQRVGAITEVPTEHLQDWLSKGRRTKPMAPEPAPDEARAPDHAPEPAAPAKDWEAEGRRAYETSRQRMVPEGLKGEDARAWERGNWAAEREAQRKYAERARRRSENRMPTSLVQFLRGMGGVRDDSGDLKSQDMHKRFIGLVSSRGVSLDRAREAAAEAGYLGHDKERAVAETTVSDLLDAIMDHPRYSADDEDAVADMKDKLAAKKHERRIAARKAEIASFMDEHGLSPDPEAIERAAALMQDEGLSMEDAFERAVMQLAHETPETKAALDATATEDGFDAIPWDEWTGPVGAPVEETAASPTRGGDQEAGTGRPARDESGGPSADSGRHSEPARAPGGEEDQAPRDEGKRSEPDQDAEIEPTESEQHAASRRMEDALDAIEIAQESGDRSKVLEAARDAKRILAETPQAITATDPEYWAQFPAAIKRMSAEGWKPITLPEATEPTVEPGADNKPQTVIPGAEKISDKALAEKKADEGLKPTVPQKGAGGMFDEANTSRQLFDDVSSPNDGSAGEARAERDARIQSLEGRKSALSEPERRLLQELRRSRHNDPSGVGRELPELLSRGRTEASPEGNDRTEEQQLGLRAGQHPLGDESGAKPQSQKQSDRGEGRGVDDVGRSGGLVGEEGRPANAEGNDVRGRDEISEAGRDAISVRENAASLGLGEGNRPTTRDDTGEIAKGRSTGESIASAVEALRDRFLDRNAEQFPTIVQARKFMLENGFKPVEGLPENKQTEEAIEHALVLAAREIVARDPAPLATFDKLVNLYNSQPRLGSRTSTSVAEQAYSTPAPLAYVASRLAGIDPTKTVLEPTAGNGMLLIEASPKKVVANELNDTRAAALREQGFGRVTQEDATRAGALPKGVDVVIANPPFGAVREGGASKVFEAQGFRTTNIDHAISLNALAAMKPDGRAVLIIGGVNSMDKAERQKGYQGQAKRKFFHTLLQNYKVADIFTVAGDLYEKQGAGWPVDVIVIDGRGKTDRPPLTLEPPPVLKTWGEVKEKLNGAPSNDEPGEPQDGVPGIRGEETGTAVERPARPPRAAEPSRNDVGGGRPAEPHPAAPPAADVVQQPDRQQPADAGSRKLGDEPQPAPRPVRDEPRVDRVPDPERGRPVEPNEAGQAPYRPASREAESLGTLIPANLRDPAANALEAVQRIHGRVDEYVSSALGYNRADLPRFFSAEQVDALALALHNIEKGDGFILGDQTGIGKGRVVAGAIRYAHIKGLTPIFATEKPDLYGDMWRDLHDIGFDQYLGRPIEMFMTNAGTRIPLDEKAVEWVAAAEAAKDAGEKLPPREGKFSTSQTADESARKIHEIIAGTFKPDVVFTTYDQMNSIKGAETDRRRFLRTIAPHAFLIMDEAHNAGGQGVPEEGGRGESKMKAPPRSKVFREALGKANSVLYSSATYAKSPKVMDLFARTDMAKAVENPAMLPDLIARGGVPLQQIVSAMLGKSGQYLRRERSFDGVDYDLEVAPVDARSYASFTEGLGAIFRFDKAFSEERKKLAEQIAQEQNAGNAMDSGTGEAGANSTEFSSIMHNAISQMVLSIKAKAAAERAVQALRDNEKPVIALSSTMEAFLTDFVGSTGLKEGNPIDLDFGGVLRRYLERTRRITIKMPDDTKKHIMIPFKDMEASTVAMYRDAEKVLDAVEMSGLPISPIDAIRAEIQRAGFTVREITGRSAMIDYSGETPVLASRAGAEQGAAGKRVTIKMFNDGKLDAVILNKSGSTGVSMHAKDTYKDRRRRRMILVQADPNIDTHMQMLGRVHRTGQVIPPAYSQLAADIPAEARPTANLMRKMASLNANTTASRKSKFTGEAVDFMNKYGDAVAAAVMREDWQLNYELGDPVRLDTDEHPNAMARVTGRLTLLPPDKQAELLDRLTNDYKALIARLDAEGKNDLEAKSIDLQARVVESQLIKPASGDSPFQGEVRLDKVSVKSQGKAMAPAEVLDAAHEAADIPKPEGATFERDLTQLSAITRRTQAKMMDDVRKAALDFSAKEVAALKTDDAKEKARKKNDAILARWQNAARMANPGNIVTVKFNGEDMPAVVIGFRKRKNVKNPVALGGWDLKLALPDSARTIEVPLSQMRTAQDAADKGEGDDKLVISAASYMDTPATLAPLFEKARKEGREDRFVFSGNILAAFDQTKGAGQIVNYTMEDGSIRPGILMPKKFSSKDFMESRAIRFGSAAQVMKFLDQFPKGEITSTDGIVAVRVGRSAIEFDLPAARGTGGKYYTDASVRAIYDAWEKRGSRMRAEVSRQKAQAILDAMMKIDAVFETRENQDAAQAIINADAPPKMAQAAPDGWGFVEPGPAIRADHVEQMRTDLERIVATVLPAGAVHAEVVPKISLHDEDMEAVRRSGGTVAAPHIMGLFTGREGLPDLIQVAMTSQNHKNTSYHEAWHSAQHIGLATEQELAVLRSPAEAQRLRRFAAQNRSEQAARQMSQVELEANYFGAYAEALDEGREPPRIHPRSMRIFDRLYELLRRLRNYFKGLGFQTTEDIIRRFQSGEMARRPFWERTDSRLYGDEAYAARFPQAAPAPGPKRHFERSTLRQRMSEQMDRLPSRDDVIESILDLHRPVKVTQEALADGARIPAQNDPYKAKRLLPGRRAAMQEDFRKDYLEPLVAEAKAAKLSRQDVSEWLFARHAPERNAAMDQIDPNNNGRGSGISDAEAFDILDRLTREGKAGGLKAIEQRVAAIREYILDTAETSGLISEEQANELRAAYQHYVPLKGWDDPTLAPDDAQDLRVGGGMRVRGAEFRKAFGRRTIAGDPLATIINDAYRMIDRATKNDALRASWRFMKGLPKDAMEGVVRLDKGKMVKALDPQTGMMRWQEEAGWRFRENVVPLKIGGKPHYIVFDDPAIAQAWMRLTPEQLHWTLAWMGPIVNTAKSFWTHYRPDFIFRHFFMRYPIEGALNAAEGGAGDMVKSFRSYPLGPTFRAIRAYAHLSDVERAGLGAKVAGGTATPQERIMAYYEEMRAHGGLMRWADFGGVERIKRQIDRAVLDLEKRPDRALIAHLRALHEGIDHITGAMDNAQRLQAYIMAREKGANRTDAALAAREATVDFALKGRIANYLTLMWPFANTAGQTASRLFRATKRSPKMMLKVLGAVAAAGFASGLYAYLMGGTDTDGVPFIEKTGDWVRRLNLVAPIPGARDAKGRPYMLTISLPYNYAFPFVFGQAAAAAAMKAAGIAKVSWGSLAHQLFHSALEATTPIAQENSMIGKFTPELMRPFMHVATNTNWYGGPIHPSEEPWKGIPKAERSFGSIGAAWKKLAETMHKYGGLDFHPEDYREILSYFTSTMQGDAARLQSAISDVLAGEPPSPTDLPVVHTLTAGGKQYDAADRRAYYEKRSEALGAETRAKALRKNAIETGEGGDKAAAYAQEHAREIAEAKQFRSTDGSRAAITKQRRRIEADQTMPADEKRRRLEMLNEKELRLMQRMREK